MRMNQNPGTWGDGFPACPNLSSASMSLNLTQGLLFSWLPTPPVKVPDVGPSSGKPGLSCLGSASRLASLRSAADGGSAARPLQECKDCLRHLLLLVLLRGGLGGGVGLPTHSRLQESSHPIIQTQSMAASPPPRLHPALDAGSCNLRLSFPGTVGQPHGFN